VVYGGAADGCAFSFSTRLRCPCRTVHVPSLFPLVIFPRFRDRSKILWNAVTRTQIGIAVGGGVLLVLVFVGYIWWLSNQGRCWRGRKITIR